VRARSARVHAKCLSEPQRRQRVAHAGLVGDDVVAALGLDDLAFELLGVELAALLGRGGSISSLSGCSSTFYASVATLRITWPVRTWKSCAIRRSVRIALLTWVRPSTPAKNAQVCSISSRPAGVARAASLAA